MITVTCSGCVHRHDVVVSSLRETTTLGIILNDRFIDVNVNLHTTPTFVSECDWGGLAQFLSIIARGSGCSVSWFMSTCPLCCPLLTWDSRGHPLMMLLPVVFLFGFLNVGYVHNWQNITGKNEFWKWIETFIVFFCLPSSLYFFISLSQSTNMFVSISLWGPSLT